MGSTLRLIVSLNINYKLEFVSQNTFRIEQLLATQDHVPFLPFPLHLPQPKLALFRLVHYLSYDQHTKSNSMNARFFLLRHFAHLSKIA